MLKKLFNRKQSDTPAIDSNAIPKHVAIIMDGNGRWAKRRGMPRSMGHRAGADVLKQIVIAADDIGIRALRYMVSPQRTGNDLNRKFLYLWLSSKNT